MVAVRPPSPPLPGAPSAAARLLRKVDRFPGRYLAGFTEVVLLALVGFQGTALYGIVAIPLKPAATIAAERPAPAPPSAILSRDDSVFGRIGGVDAPMPVPIDLKLHGVRQDGRTGGGSAIISQAGGPQRSFAVGEAISPGLVLKEVRAGYATVARLGVDERLALADFGAAISGAGSFERNGPAARPPPAGDRSSINFADPSTLPASLTAPIAATEASGKPGG